MDFPLHLVAINDVVHRSLPHLSARIILSGDVDDPTATAGGVMAYIHAAAAWGAGDDTAFVDAALSMPRRLGGQPWAQTSSLRRATAHWRAVLIGQRREQDPVLALGSCGPVHAVADVRLDADTAAPSTLPEPVGTVLEAYRSGGVRGLARLRGDGVLVIWDEEKGRLLCWRDALGTRPLYVAARPGRHVVVSSDLRSLTAHPWVPLVLDLSYARAVLEHGPEFQHPSRTLCAGVRKVPAGHVLVADERGVTVTPWWNPADVLRRRHRTDEEYVEELRHLLEVAVRRRLPAADQPLAAHLSGGLDSTSVALVAQRLRRDQGASDVVATSWAPPWDVLGRQPVDERDLVEAAAAFGHVPVLLTTLTAASVAEAETRDLALQPTTTLQVELPASRALADLGVRTVLSGWGGDEGAVYNGKGYFASLALRGRWSTLRRELTLRSRLHGSTLASEVRGRVVLPLLPDRVAAWANPRLRRDALPWPASLRPDFAAALASAEPLVHPELRERPGVHRSQIARLGWGHLQYRMESWASHGADIGLTYQYPLLDRNVVEFALGIPDHLYFQHGWKRWLYRTALAGIVPDAVRWNPHKFDAAMVAMMRRVAPDARALIRERVRDRADNPYVDVARLLDAESPDRGSAAFLAFLGVRPP
jgi:asparagine synthase (glutamine-hydrolysing)